MSKAFYNGREYDIKRDSLINDDWTSNYYIFDDEGYRLITNFNKASLKVYRRAVKLSDCKKKLKIVLNCAPYTTDGLTLRHNDRCHSLWVRPECKNLSEFWRVYDSENKRTDLALELRRKQL